MAEKKNYKWTVVALLFCVALLNYMDRQMLTTMRPAMQHDISELQSATMFGYLMGVFLWIYGFFSPVAGIIADKFDRKWLIVGSLFVWSAVTLAMGYATTFHQLYWLRALMGVSEAIYIPTGLALIVDYHKDKTRSLAIAIHMIGIYIGQASGGFGAGIAKLISWQKAFHIFGLAGIVYSVVIILFLREVRVRNVEKHTMHIDRTTIMKTFSLLFGNISFWLILFYFAVPSLIGWATKNWLPTLFSDNLGLPMSVAGPVSTISLAASSLVGVIIGGILSDRWVQKNLRGRIFTSTIGLALTIPSLLLIGYGGQLYHAVGAAICFGIGWGMYDANNMPILCQFVSAKRRSTAYGIMNMTGVFAGAFITDWLGKSIDEGTLARDFTLLSVLVLVVIGLIFVFLRPVAIDYSDK